MSDSGDIIEPSAEPVVGKARFGWQFRAAAATLLATVGVGAIMTLDRPDRWETAIGERRVIPLSDGSTVAVNTASEVTAALSRQRRAVTLAQGEALFRVAPDKARPFVVSSSGYDVVAIGTVFGVRVGASPTGKATVGVLVDEGTVEVRRSRNQTVVARLTAGMRGSFTGNATYVDTPPQATITRQLAWRNGQIDLAGEPLSAAIAEMNRYSARPIRLVDQSIAGQALHGVFRTDDAEGFARTLGVTLNVPVEIGAEEIRIGRPR